MNRKQWIIAGTLLIIVVAGLVLLSVNRPASPSSGDLYRTVPALGYCADGGAKPCVVSFSVDSQENMLINLLLPDLSFPTFYLQIVRGDVVTRYACQRVGSALNNAYCAGEKLAPGETLTFKLISTRDETLLAQGDLSIIGLAFPTLGVAVSTPLEAPTASAAQSPTPTAGTLLVLPPVETLPTVPPPAYPNPSYPNPSYPNPSYP